MRAPPESADWFAVTNLGDVPTPALLVYPERVEENIRRAISISNGVERLRPHVKTHKLEEIVRMHLARGVTKFKCATIAEAEMTASAGVPDVLLAYQLLGPNVQRLVRLVQKFPQTKFAVIADDRSAIAALSVALSAAGRTISVLLDVDCGMHRTGVLPNDDAFELYRWMTTLPALSVEGLHPYDGHIHDSDATLREKSCDAAFAPVAQFRQRLRDAGFPKVNVVAGGTPTFPFHARRGDVECSPGTYVFWDFGYASTMPDLKFELAALVLTRVVSKPGANRLCLDLGHKAIASENPHPRVQFLNLPDASAVGHSEEHLVIETSRAPEFAVGDCIYGVPRHICPTVALHSHAVVVRDGRAEERWKISARDRVLTI